MNAMNAMNTIKALAGAAVKAAQDVRELPSAFLQKDPAARSKTEIVFLYPGVRALMAHRFAHALWQADAPFLARLVSESTRTFTGIEIHPGARIGRRVVIDHGMGTVIGETAIVEDDVVIYQCVTLGGTQNIRKKRHPTIRRGSVLGVGASVLGNISVGPDARVGAGAVVVKDVAAGASVGGIPASVLQVRHLRSVRSDGATD